MQKIKRPEPQSIRPWFRIISVGFFVLGIVFWGGFNWAMEATVLAEASINTETCFPYSGPECGACNICPVPGALLWDQQRPHIDQDKCVGCGLCREACIVEPKTIEISLKN